MDIKQWWEEEVNKEALLERIFQKSTLIGLFAGAALIGWKISPIKVTPWIELLLLLYGLYKVGKNEKKTIRKAAEEL